MNRQQINLHASCKASLSVFDTYPTAWAGVTPIEESLGVIRPIVAEITRRGLKQQQADTGGHTTLKNNAIDRCVSASYKMALRLGAYADKTGDPVLQKAVNYSEYALGDGPESEVLDRCTTIAQLAEQYAPQAAAYKVTAAEVTTLKTYIAEARPLSARRDEVGAERVSHTASLPELFKELKKHFKTLDKEVEGLLDDDEFEPIYFAARRVKDLRGRGEEKKES